MVDRKTILYVGHSIDILTFFLLHPKLLRFFTIFDKNFFSPNESIHEKLLFLNKRPSKFLRYKLLPFFRTSY